MVASITRVAQDYFPNIINDMTVGGVHKILLHVKVMEISRTKLRNLGFDWAQISAGGSFVSQGVSTLLPSTESLPSFRDARGNTVIRPGAFNDNAGPTVRFGVVDSGGQFYGFIQALQQNDLARLLAEPTLVTLDGRPAKFNVGGEVPIPVPQALGVNTVTYRPFGTQIDFVPIVLGNGMIRLEVRPNITEIDPSLRDPVTGAFGFRQRMADTAVEMKAGQTLAIAGLVFTREDAVNRGIPWLADLPWAGAAFRRVENKRNDVELLIFVTPEFCEAMEPEEVPPCGPGQLTTSPTDVELYFRGYLEVPRNCPPGQGPAQPRYEELPAGPAPIPSSGAKVSGGRGNVAVSRSAGASGSVPGVSARPASVRRPNPASYGGGLATPTPAVVAPAPQPPALLGPQGYDDLR
jgi:pilus assembly protein CpaC